MVSCATFCIDYFPYCHFVTYVVNMYHMIRTQVYITDEQKRSIGLMAKQQRKPEAEVIREVLDAGLARHVPTGSAEALARIVVLGQKLGIRGESDLSAKIDELLYDEPTREERPAR